LYSRKNDATVSSAIRYVDIQQLVNILLVMLNISTTKQRYSYICHLKYGRPSKNRMTAKPMYMIAFVWLEDY